MDITSSSLAAPQATAATESASAQLTANFDTFLTLLTTQLRNQDPLNPLDTEKFTEQLVQFSSVEQSIQTNQNLEALIALQTSSSNETALAMVGKIATVNSDVATLGGSPVEWSVTLPENTAAASARIVDEQGNAVTEFTLDPSPGPQTIRWSGENDRGETARAGNYRLEIIASDTNGTALDATATARGRVDAVAFGPDGADVEIGGRLFPVSLVTRVDASS